MKKLIRFAVGGLPGALMGYLILFFCEKTGSEILLLVFISALTFFAKESMNFFIHKLWTFQKLGNGEIREEISSYFREMLFSTTISTFLFYVLIEFSSLHSVLSQVIVNSIFMFVNYLRTEKIFKYQEKLGET